MPHRIGYSNAVNLTISLCLTYTLCIASVRFWIRKGTYGIDDGVIAIATLVSLAHTAADYVALHDGLGTAWHHILDKYELSRLNEASIAGIITFVLALYLSKCATLFFLTRITKQKPSQTWLYQTCNGLFAAVGISSILLLVLECPFGSGYMWAIYRNKLLGCPSQSVRWKIYTALDIFTELLLVVLPVQLVWPLQMSRGRKGKVIAAFCLRLPAIGLSVARNYYTLQLGLSSSDPGLMSGIVVIWIEIQLAYALASSTLSASKGFVETFNSGFGFGFVKTEGGYGVRAASYTNGKSHSSTTKSYSESVFQENTIGFPYERQEQDKQPSSDPVRPGAGSTRRIFKPSMTSNSDDSMYSTNDLQSPDRAHVHADKNPEWPTTSAVGMRNPAWRPASSVYSRESCSGGRVGRFGLSR